MCGEYREHRLSKVFMLPEDEFMLYRFRLLVLLCFIAVGFVPHAPPDRVDAAPSLAIDKPTPFGIGATLANRVRDDEQDAAVALMQEAGVQWAREEIFWHELQPEQGGPYRWRGDGSGF